MKTLKVLLIALFAATVAPSAMADDHGNTFESSSLMAAEDVNHSNIAGNLETSGDIDVFQFQITQATIAWLYTTGSTDTFLELYDSNGTRLAYNQNNGSGYNAQIERNVGSRLTPGTYYISVSAGGSSNNSPQTGAYTLSIRTQTNAKAFNGTNIAGSLSILGELVFYHFPITQTTIAWLYTTGSTDTYLTLYDSNGTRLAYNQNNGSGYNAQIERNVGSRLTPGIYYVAVSAGGSSNNIPQTGAYTLSIRTQTNAKAFNGTNIADSLAIPGDLDFYQFRITQTTIAWLYTTGSTDTYLSLYNSNGTRISYNQNSGAGYNALIYRNTGSRLTPGVYYVAVSAGGSSNNIPQTGPYTLSLRTQTNAMAFNEANLTRSLAVPGDLDLHRLDIPRGGRVFLYTNGTTDTELDLYDVNGKWLNDDNTGGSTPNAFLSLNLQRGTYYVLISAGSQYGHPQTGPYILSKRTPSNAEPILTSGKRARSLARFGDVDYYSFTTRGGPVDLWTAGPTDTYGVLYQANGTVITDNSGFSDRTNENFRIQVSLAAGTYFLRITGSSWETRGNYKLNANFKNKKIITIRKKSWTKGASLQRFKIPVSANTKWSVKEKSSWISIKWKSGKGNGKVIVTLQRNRGKTRKAVITIGGIKVSIRQSGKKSRGISKFTGRSLVDFL